MHHLGNFSLMAIFVLAIYAIVASLLGVRKGRPGLIASAERSILACAGLSTASVFALVTLLFKSDFRFEYVANYSNRELPMFYKIASLWAGNDGSLLFWSWLLIVFSAVAVWTNRSKNRELMPYVVATLGVIILFFTYMNYWVTNPFHQLGVVTASGATEVFAPADGRGLNPLLQHPIMVIHPPILYIGYVSFAIPFAFCVAALLSRQLGSAWITSTRRWTLGVRRARLGRVLGVGSCGKRVTDALANRHRISALGDNPRTKRDAQGLERVPRAHDLSAVHLGHLLDAKRHRFIGARVRRV